MPQEPVILLDHVTRRFGNAAAVQDISFSIQSGQMVGMIGPSGSGKTTIVRMLCGILAPTEGIVRVLWQEPTHFNGDQRAQVGYLPQHFLLYPNLSVNANIAFMAGLYGLGLRERRRRMQEVLELVELWPDRSKQASELSGGMQRRLALAATLLHNPQLLFLDEPTTGQDPILRRKIWGWLRALEHEGRTILVTTHYVSDAEMCGQVVLLEEGHLIAFDTPAVLRQRAFGGDLLELTTRHDIYKFLRTLERMQRIRGLEVRSQDQLIIVVDNAGQALPEIANELKSQDMVPDSLHETIPPFEDVFERLIRQYQRREQREEK